MTSQAKGIAGDHGAGPLTRRTSHHLRFRPGETWRILFAFDPSRSAILLVGGNKAGDKRWYKVNVPIADERFQRHLDDPNR